MQYFALLAVQLHEQCHHDCHSAVFLCCQALLVREETSHTAGQVVAALQPLIKDSDLLLTAASLNVASTLLRHHPAVAASACQQLLPPALMLAQSPLLQANCLYPCIRLSSSPADVETRWHTVSAWGSCHASYCSVLLAVGTANKLSIPAKLPSSKVREMLIVRQA